MIITSSTSKYTLSTVVTESKITTTIVKTTQTSKIEGRCWNLDGVPSDLVLTVDSYEQISGEFVINSTNHIGHKVYISDDNITFTLLTTLTGSQNSFVASGLTPDTIYYFKVVAYKVDITSPFELTWNAQTEAIQPITINSITVVWDNINDEFDIAVDATGGTGVYTVTYTQNLNILNVVVTDTIGTTANQDVNLNDISPIVINSATYEVVGSEAIVTIVASGGFGDLTYQLGSQTNITGIFTVTEADTYAIEVSDEGGATPATSSIEITIALPAPTINSLTVVSDTEIIIDYTSDYNVEVWYSRDGLTFVKYGEFLNSPASVVSLTTYTLYYVKLRAFNNITFSEYSAISSIRTSTPLILTDGKTKAWYAGDDLTTIVKDTNNLVAQWNDKLNSGRNVTQSDNTKKPLYNNGGITFNGSDEFLKSDLFTFSQPESIYVVAKIINWAGTVRYIFDGFGASTGCVVTHTTTPKMAAFAGSFSSDDGNLPQGKTGVFRIIFNGANSKFIVDENTEITGNFGANNMTGITLGSAGGGGFGFLNVKIKEAIFRAVNESDININVIYNYLKKKYIEGKKLTTIGDSTVATYLTYSSIASLINGTDSYNIADIATAGDSISGQKTKWLALSDYNKLADYTFVQIGINDIASEWTMTQLLTMYQTLIDTIRSGVGETRKIYGCTMTPCKQWLIDTKGADNYLPFYEKWVNLNNAIRGLYSTNITGMDGYIDSHTATLNDGNDNLLAAYKIDEVHANNAGRQIIANAWATKILPV